MRRLLVILLAGFGALAWLRRGLLKSLTFRFLIAVLPDPAKARGIKMIIPVDRGDWTRFTLHADLSFPLTRVVGYPVEAAAYSHYGGFNLNNVYCDFINPDSKYYQAWIGAYTVFDSDRRKHFGFDDEGKPIQEERIAMLDADQALVFWAAGCPKKFPDGHLVKLLGGATETEVEIDGQRWWRMDGTADTWSCYHRGKSPSSNWYHYFNHGMVPEDAPHPVDDFHPVTYTGSIWARYFPEWGATCAKFYILPEYVDRNGQTVTKGRQLKVECEAIVDRIRFVQEWPPS